jgi:hypothetical protein
LRDRHEQLVVQRRAQPGQGVTGRGLARFMNTLLLSAACQVVIGGFLVFATGILIGSSQPMTPGRG